MIFRPTAISNKNKKTDFSDYQLQHLINYLFFLTTYYDLPSDDEITYCPLFCFFVYLTNQQQSCIFSEKLNRILLVGSYTYNEFRCAQ